MLIKTKNQRVQPRESKARFSRDSMKTISKKAMLSSTHRTQAASIRDINALSVIPMRSLTAASGSTKKNDSPISQPTTKHAMPGTKAKESDITTITPCCTKATRPRLFRWLNSTVVAR
jgi:hypothetical protein